MVVAEFSVTPVGEEEMRPYVDTAVEQIKQSGLKYEVDALSTTMEGDLDQIFEVVKKAHAAVRQKGVGRVITELRIDDKEEGVSIEDEVEGYR